MKKIVLSLILSLVVYTGLSAAANAHVNEEVAYIYNTFSFLFHGVLVMWMAAGFTMLESGLVRSKNTATICLKNIGLYSTAGICYYVIGYSVMYTDVSGLIGSFSFFYSSSTEELALLAAGGGATAEQVSAVTSSGYSTMSDWFFQMVFVATTASIISGTVAERIKILPFMLFVVVLTSLIYPIQGSWVWGGGWLSDLGFSDFAGSTLVHSVGGWAALVGAYMVGPREGKYGKKKIAIVGANLPLATLGVFILWMGWFGFNGGSQLAMQSAADVIAISLIYVNTNLAAAAGVITAIAMSWIVNKRKIDLTLVLNGAIAGLVAITAGPDVQNHLLALIIGGVGGLLVVVTVPLLDYLRIDDVVGAIPAHLVAGIWGTLCVGIFGSGSVLVQLTGIVAIGGFVVVSAAVIWYVLDKTIGLRVDAHTESEGLDESELGLHAYPEFVDRPS